MKLITTLSIILAGVAAAAQPDRFDEFLQWYWAFVSHCVVLPWRSLGFTRCRAANNGVTWRGIEFVRNGQDTHVVATRALAVDDVLLEVPAVLALNERTANRTRLGPMIAELRERHGPLRASLPSCSRMTIAHSRTYPYLVATAAVWDGFTSLVMLVMYEACHNPQTLWARPRASRTGSCFRFACKHRPHSGTSTTSSRSTRTCLGLTLRKHM